MSNMFIKVEKDHCPHGNHEKTHRRTAGAASRRPSRSGGTSRAGRGATPGEFDGDSGKMEEMMVRYTVIE